MIIVSFIFCLFEIIMSRNDKKKFIVIVITTILSIFLYLNIDKIPSLTTIIGEVTNG